MKVTVERATQSRPPVTGVTITLSKVEATDLLILLAIPDLYNQRTDSQLWDQLGGSFALHHLIHQLRSGLEAELAP